MNKLLGKNIVVYDIEIKIGVPPLTWDDKDKMGVSSVALYDYRDGFIKVYMDDNIQHLNTRLMEADLIVGFNHIDFDEVVLQRSGLKEQRNMYHHYDICQEGRKALGWKEGDKYPGRISLDNYCKATLGVGKQGNAALAPELYQAKRFGELITYNISDVILTCRLFGKIWVAGLIRSQKLASDGSIEYTSHNMSDPRKFIKEPKCSN